MTIEDRLAALEARLREAEDRLAIIDLLAAYGPAVDSGEGRFAAELWGEDGSYDVGGMWRARGHDAIAALYEADLHQGLIAQGSGHITSTPSIRIEGDRAQAVAHSFVLLREGERWIVYRASANHFTLVRTANGWRIAERRNRTLDGSAESHETLRRIV